MLTLDRDGIATIVYDGDYDAAWGAAGKPQKNGQRATRLPCLRRLTLGADESP